MSGDPVPVTLGQPVAAEGINAEQIESSLLLLNI
jgi:hypothetical protein